MISGYPGFSVIRNSRIDTLIEFVVFCDQAYLSFKIAPSADMVIRREVLYNKMTECAEQIWSRWMAL